jgi:hypothetical protein
VCTGHGAKAPQVREAARRRELEARAAKELGRFSSAPPVSDPFSELLKLAGEAGAWKAFCEDRLTALEELRYSSAMLLEQQRSEVSMYQAAVRLSLDVNVAVAKLDCEARLSRVKEATGAKLIEAMDRVARKLKFTPETRKAVWSEYAAELHRLEAIERGETA